MEKTNNDKKKALMHRLKIVQGHINKVVNMIEKDDYCIDVLHQSLAVQSALKQIDSIILENHLASCIPEAMPAVGKKKQQELLDVFKASRK